MKSRKSFTLVLGSLLCLVTLMVNISHGLTPANVQVRSSGLVNYTTGTGHYHSVGFENQDDVRFPLPVGLCTQDQAYVFQSENSAWSVSFADMVIDRIVPGTSVGVRPGSLGSYVLRLWLKNPTTDYTRRIHIRHLWNPMNTYDIWQDGWVYFPSDVPPADWVTWWAMNVEREWNPTYVDAFALGLNLNPSTTGSDGTVLVGTILNFYWPSGSLYHDYPKTDLRIKANGIVFGEWNYVKSHVYRPLDAPDPTTNTAGGYFEVWIANSKTNWQLAPLDWYETYGPNPGKHWGTRVYCRTVGEKPSVLATFPAAGDTVKGWLESGLDLYVPTGGSPREIYFDDVTLSSTEI